MSRNPIHDNFIILCNQLNLEKILPYLKHERMVTTDEYQILTNATFTARQKREKLLIWLPRKGRNYFTNFGKCLVWSGQVQLARHIGVDVASVPEAPFKLEVAPSIAPEELKVSHRLPTTTEFSWKPIPATVSSTTPEGAPSVSPEGLKVSHRLPTTAELSWKPIPEEKRNGVITGYTVQVEGPDSRQDILVEDTCTSVQISDLRPFTWYTFKVNAMTKAGTGPAATVSSTTPEGAPSVAPEGLRVGHRLSTTAELSWKHLPGEKRNGVITGYTVQVEGPGFSQKMLVQDVKTEIPSLRPFTSYTFKVSAMTKAGTGPAATISSITPRDEIKDLRWETPSPQQQSLSGIATSTAAQPLPFPATCTTDKRTNFDKIPTLDELLILKYMDKGKKKKLRIIDEASHKWKDITDLISNDANIASVLQEKYCGDPKECLRQAFVDNFINKKPLKYSQDWDGLIELLDDVGLETLSENVKHALPYAIV